MCHNSRMTQKIAKPAQSILRQWKLTEEEFTEIVRENPSMRGLVAGYVAEFKLRKMHFSDSQFTSVVKDDDHDRRRKGDLRVTYKRREFVVECKSLLTSSVKRVERDGAERFEGAFGCDASDRRPVTLPNGDTLSTTCLVRGGFDLLAVNLFAFGEQEWRFGFVLERDMPGSKYRKYTAEQRRHLLASSGRITWPLAPPFETEPRVLLDRLIRMREA